MAEKDISEKLLESHNDVFSDIFNALVFEGKQVIQENSLVDAKTEGDYYDHVYDIFREHHRDVAKFWTHQHTRLAILGLENQTDIKKNMIFRVMNYDSVNYMNQIRKGFSPLLPVATLVLYFGIEKPWNSNLSVFDTLNVPECLRPYVNNYKMHVINLAFLTDEEIARFHSDFKNVALILRAARLKFEKKKETVKLDNSVLKHKTEITYFLRTISKNLKNFDIGFLSKGCDVDMKAIMEAYDDELIALGKADGIAEGKAVGIAEGIMEQSKNVALQMLKNGEPLSKILLYSSLTLEKIQKLADEYGITPVAN